MTVIVYAAGVMAADTAEWEGPTLVGHVKKVRRYPDGSLAGACGDVPDIQAFHLWGAASFPPSQKPEITNKDHFKAIHVSADGVITNYFGDLKTEHAACDWSCAGVNSQAMVTLLIIGWSAEEVVAHMIKHTAYVAGKVYSLSLSGGEDEDDAPLCVPVESPEIDRGEDVDGPVEDLVELAPIAVETEDPARVTGDGWRDTLGLR